MRELTLRQAPACLKVFRKVLGLLDGSDNSGVDGLLVSGFGFGEGLLLLGLALREELLLRRRGALSRGLCEVGVVDFLVNLNRMAQSPAAL